MILIISFWAWKKYKIENPAEVVSETREPTGFVRAMKNKFFVDEFYNAIIVKPLRIISKALDKIDRSGIDGIVNGFGKSINYSSRQIRLLQSGQVGSYILLMVLAMLVIFVLQFFLRK